MKTFIAIALCVCIFASCKTHQKTISGTSAQTSTTAKKVADGSSYEQAIVIADRSEGAGIASEYKWIRDTYPGSKTNGQSLNYHNNKPFDIIHVVLADGSLKDIYFDISNFFGKY